MTHDVAIKALREAAARRETLASMAENLPATVDRPATAYLREADALNRAAVTLERLDRNPALQRRVDRAG